MVTLETLGKSPFALKGYDPLAEAVRFMSIPPIRHGAAIGGKLWLDTPCLYDNQSEFWRRAIGARSKRGGDIDHAVEKGRPCEAVYQGGPGPILTA